MLSLRSRLLSVSIPAMAAVGQAATGTSVHAIRIGGIEFPAGAVSFADLVVSYTPGAGVGTSGSQVFNDPSAALGTPNYNGNTGAVSLGRAVAGNPGIAQLIVRFTDNSLTTSGNNTPDLHIFEVGADVEPFLIAISQDGLTWVEIGSLSGQPTSIDIDAVAGVIPGAKYSFVRLRDDPNTTSPFNVTFAEADIDAIGAISSAAAVGQARDSELG
jgi:hypothetical protein